MYSIASAAASGSATSSSDPSRKTVAWRTASSSGWTFSSAGISGITAAPSGTSSSCSAMLASGHGGDDGQLVAVLDGRGQVVEVTDVFLVEVQVHEPAHLTVLEDARRDTGGGRPEAVQHGLHRGAARLDDGLALGVLPHGRRKLSVH